MLCFILFCSFALLLFAWVKYKFSYWKSRGVPGPSPTFLVGNVVEFFLLKKYLGTIFTELYNEYQGYPFIGIYKGLTPCLIVREPDFIKNILNKDFKSFYNNDNFVDRNIDPIFGSNLFILKDGDWKNMKSKISPGFTTGKMKSVFPLIEEVCQNLVNYVARHVDASNISTCESKELCATYSIDNVASCAFGVEGKCLEDPHSHFKRMADRYLSPGSWTSCKILVAKMFPGLMRLLKMKLTPQDADDKLRETIAETLKYRKENEVERKDYLDLLWTLFKKLPDFTMEDIFGQAAAFFSDGYETTSGAMSFMVFEIAGCEYAQKKLREEIESTLEENGGNLTYDVVNDMKYLDAVVAESLRKNPPVLTLGKLCTERYTYSTVDTENFKDMTVTVEPGTSMILPMAGVHWDDTYFEDPEAFRPERFLNEGKILPKYVYFPFGDGPRVCIGQKFGMIQVKVALIYLVRHFEMSINKRTKLPITFDPTNFLLVPKGGLWIDFKRIR